MAEERQHIDEKIISEAVLRIKRLNRLDDEARGNIAEFFKIIHEWAMRESAEPDAEETSKKS